MTAAAEIITPSAELPPPISQGELLRAEVDNAVGVFARARNRAMRARDALATTDFAERYITLEKNAEPGRYNSERTPYLREVQDAFGDLSIPLVVHIKPTQIGSTQALVNAVCRVIHSAPTVILFITETGDKARTLVRDRFDKVLRAAPFELPDTRLADNRDSFMSRSFPGGSVEFFGSKSASSFSSLSAQLVVLDEYARFPADVGGEGSPLALAFGRGRTFGENAAVRVNSTPLIVDDGEGSLYTAWLLGDCREWMWHCQECGEQQHYQFANFRYKPRDGQKTEAWFECAGCGARIGEEQRERILSEGRWVPTKKPLLPGARSYHSSGFMAPTGWTSWGQIADQHRLALHGKLDLASFYNLQLGEFSSDAISLPVVAEVVAHCKGYKMDDEVLPEGALLMTAAVDCQAEYLKCATYAWGREMKCWLLDWRVIPNPITSREGRAELVEYLSRRRRSRAGAVIPLTLACIDSGGAAGTTAAVYNFGAKFPQPAITPKAIRFSPSPTRPYVLATKGGKQLTPDKLVVRAAQIKKDKAKVGQRLWIMGTPLAKAELYRWLRRAPEDNETSAEEREWGGISLPADVGEEYAQEMVAEIPRKTRSPTTGETTIRWYLPSGRANEGLDLHVMNRFAAGVMGLELAADGFWRGLEARAAASEGQRVVAAEGERKVRRQARASDREKRRRGGDKIGGSRV